MNKDYTTQLNDRFTNTCDKIEDSELKYLISFYSDLSLLIDCLGAEFGLQKKEIRLRLEKLEGFKRERNIK